MNDSESEKFYLYDKNMLKFLAKTGLDRQPHAL